MKETVIDCGLIGFGLGGRAFHGPFLAAVPGLRQHRLLRLLTPAWLKRLIASDLAHNHPGDGLERFTQNAEAFVRASAAASDVNVTFYEDSANMTTGNVANQLFTAQAAGDLENYPPTSGGVTSARVISYLFPEGTFARADAGTLDLGVVRDATLNGTNDFELFSESWKAIVPKVIEAYKWTATLCETGQGAIDVTSSAFCTAS